MKTAMKILLRADASRTQGTGHVMRVLTLSEELQAAGHRVVLASAPSGIGWLEAMIDELGIERVEVAAHSLGAELIREFSPDWLVVDSYEIPAEKISDTRSLTHVAAIVDADSRAISADLYIDHNVGAENIDWPASVKPHMLAGSRYALIRRAIREVKRADPWKALSEPPRILGFMGGTDPTGMIMSVARALAALPTSTQGVVICAPAWRDEVTTLLAGHTDIEVIPPTTNLPALLAATDIAVSAAGTSSWELCTLGIPSILIEVVDNQTESLREMTRHHLVIGLSPADFDGDELTIALTAHLNSLSKDESARKQLSLACAEMFDGNGAKRVVEAMTDIAASEQTRG